MAGVRERPDRTLALLRSYDGFARVAMSMGTNQLILGLSYYAIWLKHGHSARLWVPL